jgi:hypothetical protein
VHEGRRTCGLAPALVMRLVPSLAGHSPSQAETERQRGREAERQRGREAALNPVYVRALPKATQAEECNVVWCGECGVVWCGVVW